jgi:hypothetical protein
VERLEVPAEVSASTMTVTVRAKGLGEALLTGL